MSSLFTVAILLTACIAGATASVVGFGIGSLLTPVLATRFGMEVAIASVALPHLAGGLLRGGGFDALSTGTCWFASVC